MFRIYGPGNRIRSFGVEAKLTSLVKSEVSVPDKYLLKVKCLDRYIAFIRRLYEQVLTKRHAMAERGKRSWFLRRCECLDVVSAAIVSWRKWTHFWR